MHFIHVVHSAYCVETDCARGITLHLSRHCEMTCQHHQRKRRNQQKASPRSNRPNYSLDRLTAMIMIMRIKVLEMMTMTIITIKTMLDPVHCLRLGFIGPYWTKYVLHESLHFSRGPISDIVMMSRRHILSRTEVLMQQ